MNGKNIIEVRNVTMRFGGVTAVSELDMNIPEGGIVGLIGPNGAGKTTVFNVITGFYKPTEGDVVFAGRRITGMAPHAICPRFRSWRSPCALSLPKRELHNCFPQSRQSCRFPEESRNAASRP